MEGVSHTVADLAAPWIQPSIPCGEHSTQRLHAELKEGRGCLRIVGEIHDDDKLRSSFIFQNHEDIHRHPDVPPYVQNATANERSVAKIDFIPSTERVQRAQLGIPPTTAPKGVYAIEGHGCSWTIYDKQGRAMTARELARWITNDPRYRKGMPVWLLCCDSGRGRRPIAQDLADILGTTVLAPTERLWPLRNGSYIIAKPTPDHKRADLAALGQMKTFQPR